MSVNVNTDLVLPKRWVVMGVCGSGKTEIANRLASRLGVACAEGDQFHAPHNVAKMAAGVPLDDLDRHEWLLLLQSLIRSARNRDEGLVVACSALKRRYRDMLRTSDPGLVFVHLEGDRELIASRMLTRPDHYMPLSLLDSQFRDLEPLAEYEKGASLNISAAPNSLVEEILQRFGSSRPIHRGGVDQEGAV